MEVGFIAPKEDLNDVCDAIWKSLEYETRSNEFWDKYLEEYLMYGAAIGIEEYIEEKINGKVRYDNVATRLIDIRDFFVDEDCYQINTLTGRDAAK